MWGVAEMELSPDQQQRYARHFVLKEIGKAGQKKLLKSRVLVVGAGGLGSAVLPLLAGAGVGTIGIVDDDTVSLSNLQRQVLHTTDRVGMLKVESARLALSALNPDTAIHLYPCRLTAENALSLIDGYDFAVDCVDRFETKFLLSDACVSAGTPFCHAGVVRFGGQVMTCVPGQGPCLRCLLEEVPKNLPLCTDIGVLGAAVGVIGSLQAAECIKYLTGCGHLLSGQVLHIDLLTMRMRKIPLPRRVGCLACGGGAEGFSLQDHAAEYETNEKNPDETDKKEG